MITCVLPNRYAQSFSRFGIRRLLRGRKPILLYFPLEFTALEHPAPGREKARAILPEKRPDIVPIGLRHEELLHLRAGEKSELSFRVNRRHLTEALLHLE